MPQGLRLGAGAAKWPASYWQELSHAQPVLHRSHFVPPGSSGWTLGRHVFIRPEITGERFRRLLLHELVHVVQYRRMGGILFLVRYLSEYFANLLRTGNHREAYLGISLEAEARNLSDT